MDVAESRIAIPLLTVDLKGDLLTKNDLSSVQEQSKKDILFTKSSFPEEWLVVHVLVAEQVYVSYGDYDLGIPVFLVDCRCSIT